MNIRFYTLAALYLLIIFGSIYGLFVDEISINVGDDSRFHYSLTGWSKNLLCLFGLFIAGAASSYPIFLAVYRALSNNKL